MNTKITALCTALLLVVSIGVGANETEKPKADSPEFARMKTLVGSWTGKADMGAVGARIKAKLGG